MSSATQSAAAVDAVSVRSVVGSSRSPACRSTAVTPSLAAIRQRRRLRSASHWVRVGEKRFPGLDDDARLDAIEAGLNRLEAVEVADAAVADADLDAALAAIHDRDYLDALARASDMPKTAPAFAPPGLAPDVPLTAGLVAAACEGARTAIAAARRVLAGERIAYALCRPPGHHAGPAFLGGYCYLNNAAAAATVLREGGLGPVAILDLDLHYPNGTAAIVERWPDVRLTSLHAAPPANVAPGTDLPSAPDETIVGFAEPPGPAVYADAVAAAVAELRPAASCLVVSIGFDTVAGDPHGGWGLAPADLRPVGRLLAAAGLPLCVVQEGGYALGSLAECAESFAAGLLEGVA